MNAPARPLIRRSLACAARQFAACAALCLSFGAHADEVHPIFCEVTYAGQTQRIEVLPTTEPYRVKPQSVGDRFLFKALHARVHPQTERLSIYVYRQDSQNAVLIQHIDRLPPFPAPPVGGHVDLFGEQHLYSGELERELIYQCRIMGRQP